MQYEKTIKDVFDDAADVSVTGERVQVLSADVDMLYTPKQARRLARALKRAANVAEGKPAKAKRRVIDGDGDTWKLGDNGLYSLPSEPHMPPRSLDAIRNTYGIAGERP